MKLSILAAAATLAVASAACASGPKPPEGAAPRIGADEPAMLLAHARKLRTEKGCAASAPAYRVVAGMGEGQEAAQHELGECLLTINGATETETALFRDEGRFWLTRAAYAGNARAQRALAVYFGSASNSGHSSEDALKWTLVYGKNGDADLYGYKALPSTFAPGLRQTLSDEEIAEAEKFAKEFRPIALAPFEPAEIKRERADRQQPPQQGAPQGRRRRPGA